MRDDVRGGEVVGEILKGRDGHQQQWPGGQDEQQ